MDKRLKTLRQRLDKATTEEEVKSAWARLLGLDYDTSDDIDLYTPQLLFEFKYERKLANASQLAPVLAQLMPAAARAAESESPALHAVTMHAVLTTCADDPCWKN